MEAPPPPPGGGGAGGGGAGKGDGDENGVCSALVFLILWRRDASSRPSCFLCLSRAYTTQALSACQLSVLRKRRDSIYSVTISPCPCLSVRSDGAPTRAAEHGRLRGDRGAGCGLHCRPYVCSAAAHHMGKFQLHVLSPLGHGPLGTGKTGGAGKGCSYAISFRTLTFLLFDEPKPSTQGLHRHKGRRTLGRAEACGHAELWTSDTLITSSQIGAAACRAR